MEGCTLEAGPDSFLAIKPAALDLIRDLGLADQVIGSNDHLRITYRPQGWPPGAAAGRPDDDGAHEDFAPADDPPGGLGHQTAHGHGTVARAQARAGDESVAEFIEEHYGREAVDYLAEPLLSGVYGGDPTELSVQSVLPLCRSGEPIRQPDTRRAGRARESGQQRAGAAPAPLFRTLKGGLGQMADAVAAAIRGKVEVRQGRVETVERAGAGFRVKVAGDWLQADRVVLACEAHSAAALAATLDGRLAELLGMVPYSSSMTVAVGFDAADLSPAPVGFGFLVPRKERRRLVACTWVGTKFSYRVPEGKIVARCFLGGTEDAGVLEESDDAVIAAVTGELREIAGIVAQPRFTRIARWPRAMAQYTVGHGRRLAEVEARVAAIAGLHVAGNAYTGIGVPDCIRMGRKAAEEILAD